MLHLSLSKKKKKLFFIVHFRKFNINEKIILKKIQDKRNSTESLAQKELLSEMVFMSENMAKEIISCVLLIYENKFLG